MNNPVHLSRDYQTTYSYTIYKATGQFGVLHCEMDALSPRSVNIQVQRKPFAEKDFAAADAPKSVAAKPAEKPKDKEHASAPPAWVFQPPLRPGLLAEKFQTGAFLGRGGFAICYVGELRVKKNGLANCKFAMKIVKAKMTQTKITEKVCSIRDREKTSGLIYIQVSYRASNPCEDEASQHCPIPPCIHIYREYLRNP